MKPKRTSGAPPKANATRAGGVSVVQIELGVENDSAVPAWQQGLGAPLIASIRRYRGRYPNRQLPAPMQRRCAHAWIAHAGRHP